MNFPYRLSAVLVGSAAIALVQFQQAVALTSQEIRGIAKEFTVMISTEEGGGSGVIIDMAISKNNKNENIYTVLTAHHVVEKAGAYAIQTADGAKYEIFQSTRLANVDLAVIQFKSRKQYAVAQTSNSNLPEGSTVYVAGYPGALPEGQPRTYNFIAALTQPPKLDAPEGYELRYTGQAFKGMSGGPVLDNQSRVIGIHGLADTIGVGPGNQVVATAGIPIEIYKNWQSSITQNPTPRPHETPTPTPAPQPTPVVRATPTPAPQPTPVVRATPTPAPQPTSPTIDRGPITAPVELALNTMIQSQQTLFPNLSADVNVLAQKFKIKLPAEYHYAIRRTTRAAYHYAIPVQNRPDLKAYVGAVFLAETATETNPVTVAIVCQAIDPNPIRPADPKYVKGNLNCGVGTEVVSVSDLAETVSQLGQSPTKASTPSNVALSLVNMCSTYNESLHQTQALDWLQSQMPQETLLIFADKWRSQLLAKARGGAINLTDACKFFDKTGKHPHQNRALEWLEEQVPAEIFKDFSQRWTNEAAGS